MDEATASTAPQSPLAAERARLRKQGYSDDEIAQILISRAVGGHQSESPAHGVMTGVASNLAAAGTYAKNFIPGLVADFVTIRDPDAVPNARGAAAVAFAVKIIVVAVIGYVVLQEFSQLRSATIRASAEACVAEQQAVLKSMPSNPEADDSYARSWRNRMAAVNHDCLD